MKTKVLQNDEDYEEALVLMERIGDDPDLENSPELLKQFDFLLRYIKDYEERHYAFNAGDPIAIIKLKMEYMELKAKDLIPYIGSKGIVSEVLNKKRRLSKAMIRNLSEFLKIDQDLLNVHYDIQTLPKLVPVIQSELNEFSFSGQLRQQVEAFTKVVFQRKLLFNVCPIRCQ